MSDASAHTSPPHHHLRVDARLGPLHLHADLDLNAPWTVIFGPSGSGKSTLLRAVCGLLPRGTDGVSAGASNGLAMPGARTLRHPAPPHLRRIAYAPQGGVLFPHLSVRKNISFAADATRRPSPQLTAAALALFDLLPLADRLPRDLSGGERQRVNLARAFAVPDPTLFLLDEPFTGIDRATRDRLVPALRQHSAQLGVPVLSVTHDVEEALLLQAEVVRIEQGRVTDQGPASQVLAAERSSILQSLARNA